MKSKLPIFMSDSMCDEYQVIFQVRILRGLHFVNHIFSNIILLKKVKNRNKYKRSKQNLCNQENS